LDFAGYDGDFAPHQVVNERRFARIGCAQDRDKAASGLRYFRFPRHLQFPASSWLKNKERASNELPRRKQRGIWGNSETAATGLR